MQAHNYCKSLSFCYHWFGTPLIWTFQSISHKQKKPGTSKDSLSFTMHSWCYPHTTLNQLWRKGVSNYSKHLLYTPQLSDHHTRLDILNGFQYTQATNYFKSLLPCYRRFMTSLNLTSQSVKHTHRQPATSRNNLSITFQSWFHPYPFLS